MRKFIAILILCVSLCGCDKGSVCGDCCDGTLSVYPNMDIGDMRDLYAGEPVTVNRDAVIAGRVTANDLSGNFYRTFIIEDATGAVEVRAGLYDLKNLFPEGRYVVVRAGGLTISDYNGVLQIGLAPSGGRHQADYFGHRAVVDKYVVRGRLEEKIIPMTVRLDQLDDDMCGRLVRIEGVALKDGEAGTWASADDFSSYSTRVFRSADGWEIDMSTSKYASFAGEMIPVGTVSLTGILMKETNYALRLRTIGDVEVD